MTNLEVTHKEPYPSDVGHTEDLKSQKQGVEEGQYCLIWSSQELQIDTLMTAWYCRKHASFGIWYYTQVYFNRKVTQGILALVLSPRTPCRHEKPSIQ